MLIIQNNKKVPKLNYKKVQTLTPTEIKNMHNKKVFALLGDPMFCIVGTFLVDDFQNCYLYEDLIEDTCILEDYPMALVAIDTFGIIEQMEELCL